MLENLISRCCLLEKLTLNYYWFPDLIIDAPNLEHLQISGFLEGISLKNTYCSPSFHLVFYEDRTYTPAPNAVIGYINLFKFFAPLRNVEILRLDGYALKYLCVQQEVPAMLAKPFLHLKTLVINGVPFKSVKGISVILCLLRSAPNRNHVKFSAPDYKEDPTNENNVRGDDSSGIEMYDSPYTFAHLNSASLIGICYSGLEVGFIGVLL